MASAEQLKALIRSHAKGDEEHFYRIVLQVADHHSSLGHEVVARGLRELVLSAQQSKQPPPRGSTLIARLPGPLEGLLRASYPDARLHQLVLPLRSLDRLQRILKEHHRAQDLIQHGLKPRRKLLFFGPPGTGKTATAHALAGELQLPLFLVRFESLIAKYLGETAANLGQIFQAMVDVRGVYFFDEFDAIGGRRSASNDVGEIRRVVNSFLQFIEADDSQSFVIAATNHGEMLDEALFRRFDDVIRYELPNLEQLADTMNRCLEPFGMAKTDWKEVAETALGLSYADVIRACEDTAKDAVLENRTCPTLEVLKAMVEMRKRSQEDLES